MKTIIIILIGCLLLVSFGWYKSCQTTPEEAYWKGKYDTLADKHNELKVNADSYIEEVNDMIEKHSVIVSVTEAETSDLESVIAKQKKELTELESIPLPLDLSSKVDTLERTNLKLRQIVANYEQVVTNKDKIIFSLKEKYEYQLNCTNTYKALYESEAELHAVALKRLSICEKKGKSLRFMGTIKSALIVGLGGFVVYSLVR